MYNSITALGRLGTDPEMRYTDKGTAVTNFSLATDVGWGDNKQTVWFRVNCWDKMAESANQYLEKGRSVLVVGELSQREYTTQGGETRTSLEVRARDLKFINDGQSQAAPKPAAAPVETTEELPW
jgi:single-strand DNA-binding protein